MKLQNLTVIFIIIIIPVILLVSLYITTGIKTIKYQSLYDTGLLTATHDAIYAFELNTTNDAYSDNAETKRNILKSSVKAFEKSLCNTCNISSYNVDEIEEYIPAIVFGMYDGFYMYAPSLNPTTGEYEHNLKNYVYYSEEIDNGSDGKIIIRYSLDNYISVSGYFKENNSSLSKSYITKEGYLTNLAITDGGLSYGGLTIKDEDAKKYYSDAFEFSYWIDNQDGIPDYIKEAVKASDNDPEDPNSAFVQHKNKIIKEKIESVLNSSITAYSERTWGQTYKMPKLSEEDWQKIYSNISMITFFQGKSIGLTKYNGYCVLNSTNSNEYVNPNLMYFINGNDDTDHYYHDIRCTDIADVSKAEDLKGYKIGNFQKIKLSKALNADGSPKILEGKQLYDDNDRETTSAYKYNHNALACYDCINGSLSASTSVYDYVKPDGGTASNEIKTAYWNSLARERYNTIKLLKENGSAEEKEDPKTDFNINGQTNLKLDDAIAKAKGEFSNGKNIIELNKDINYDITISGTNKKFAIDLNGHTINGKFDIGNIGGAEIKLINRSSESVILDNINISKTVQPGKLILEGNITINGDIGTPESKVPGIFIKSNVIINGDIYCNSNSGIYGGTINGHAYNSGTFEYNSGIVTEGVIGGIVRY